MARDRLQTCAQKIGAIRLQHPGTPLSAGAALALLRRERIGSVSIRLIRK
jgi:hypothetical protein